MVKTALDFIEAADVGDDVVTGTAAKAAGVPRSSPGGAVARFTAQLVALCYPDRKVRVQTISRQYRISQATVMRAIIDLGLPLLEKRLQDGKLDPTTLA